MALRQRVITVPKDKAAEVALDYDSAKARQLIELTLTEDEFEVLWKNGVFDLINQMGNAMIDDFEDSEVIGKENLINVIKALKAKEHIPTVSKLVELFKEAFDRNTAIYFFF